MVWSYQVASNCSSCWASDSQAKSLVMSALPCRKLQRSPSPPWRSRTLAAPQFGAVVQNRGRPAAQARIPSRVQGTRPCLLPCVPPSHPHPQSRRRTPEAGVGTNAPFCFRNLEPVLATKSGVFWISFSSQTITKKKSAPVPPFGQTSSPLLLSGPCAPAAAGTAAMLDGAGRSGAVRRGPRRGGVAEPRPSPGGREGCRGGSSRHLRAHGSPARKSRGPPT